MKFNPLMLFKMQLSPPQNVFNMSLYFFFSYLQVNGTEIEYEFEEITLERVSKKPNNPKP